MHLNPYKWNCLLSWKAWARGEGWHRPNRTLLTPSQISPGLIFFLGWRGGCIWIASPWSLILEFSGLACLAYICGWTISTCMDSNANSSTSISRIFPCCTPMSIYWGNICLEKHSKWRYVDQLKTQGIKATDWNVQVKKPILGMCFNSWISIFAPLKYSCREDRT